MRARRVVTVALVAALAAAVAVVLGLTPISRPTFIDRLEYPLEYVDIVRLHAAQDRLDAALLAAVIYEESRFRPNARSKVGAIGLMQLSPVTAATIARRTGGTRFRVDDLYDPEINVRFGAWYLRHLFDKYGDERLALAAYNTGETNVDRWLQRGEGIQFADVRDYVDKVEHTKAIYRHAYGSDLPSA